MRIVLFSHVYSLVLEIYHSWFNESGANLGCFSRLLLSTGLCTQLASCALLGHHMYMIMRSAVQPRSKIGKPRVNPQD